MGCLRSSLRAHHHVGRDATVLDVRQTVEDVLRRKRPADVGREVRQDQREHGVLHHADRDAHIVLGVKVCHLQRQVRGPMYGHIHGKAYEDGLLVEDFLAAVEDAPRKGCGRKAIGQRRAPPRRVVGLVLFVRHGAFIDDPQLLRGPPVQSKAPVEQLAVDILGRRALAAFQHGPDTVDVPLRHAMPLLQRSADLGRSPIPPRPPLRLTQQLAHGLDFGVLHAELDDPLGVLSSEDMADRNLQERQKGGLGQCQQLRPSHVQRLEKVSADIAANTCEELRVVLHVVVQQRLHTVADGRPAGKTLGGVLVLRRDALARKRLLPWWHSLLGLLEPQPSSLGAQRRWRRVN
mmetsp:Transcript_66081/g.132624  ORF Transcript_66081/g.132624 Transcript_66081/m.132624 type:complete len:348 (-) Transcript_66081:423-1466(-)